jgi:hypothetical protein
MIQNNDGHNMLANHAEETIWSAHLHSGSPTMSVRKVMPTEPPHYVESLCHYPSDPRPLINVYGSACACAGATPTLAIAPIYVGSPFETPRWHRSLISSYGYLLILYCRLKSIQSKKSSGCLASRFLPSL